MASSSEEPPKDEMELPMVVTNETMEEDRTATVAVKEEKETSDEAEDGGGEKLEPRTPRARGGGERENAAEEKDKPQDNATASTAAAAPAAAAPAPYPPPYHYHHNNAYPQYPHHPTSQWNPTTNQWNNHRHPHPPQQHPQSYHPYYSRYYHAPYKHPHSNAAHPTTSSSGTTKKEDAPAAAKDSSASTTNNMTYPSSQPYPHYHWRYYNNYYYPGYRNAIPWSGSMGSTTSTAAASNREKNKKRSREGGGGEEDGRELGRSYTEDTASTLSIGGLSMDGGGGEQTKASSPKRKKGMVRNQNIHRDRTDETPREFPRLDNTSTLSDGKMILQNLSITSLGSLQQTYSAEIAELCGPSPIHVDKKLRAKHMSQREESIDQGKTPKKRNTSSKKMKDSSVFRLMDPPSTTPAAMRLASQDDDSPNMLDLIYAGTETPLLLGNMENVILDDSITKQLRGQAFTPLPHILGGDDVWSFNGSPLGSSMEKLTPRFGLDSTRSKKNPLASPKSFWKEDFLDEHQEKRSKSKKESEKGKLQHQEGVPSILSMLSPAMREMDPVDPTMEGGPTSPIPIHRKAKEEASSKSSSLDNCVSTPLRRPPTQVTSGAHHPPLRSHHPSSSPWRADHPRSHPVIMHSPIPTGHSHPHHMSPYDGRYAEHRRDAPHYGRYPPPHHRHHYNPDDRIRNLRGRAPPVHHHMPPSHHLPPPSYHHFSPLTNAPQQRNWQNNQSSHMDSTGMSTSKRKCVPLRPPVPAKFQGDIEKFKDAQVPEFNNLVNFPAHMNQKQSPNVPDGMRCCVMCGQACPCSQGGKQKKGDKMAGVLAPLGSNKGLINNTGSGFAIIPTQNKGLCTLCDVNVWIVTQTGLEIKWCKGCKNFRPWAAFGDKGLATKCVRCRDRQREKYALQKEEKERQRGMAAKNVSVSALPPMGSDIGPC